MLRAALLALILWALFPVSTLADEPYERTIWRRVEDGGTAVDYEVRYQLALPLLAHD